MSLLSATVTTDVAVSEIAAFEYNVLMFVPGQRLRGHNFYILVISSLLAFSLVEGFCRLLNIGNPEIAVWKEERNKDKSLPYAYKPNGKLLYLYPDNPRGYFDKNNEVSGSINSKGFRGIDIDFEKDSEKIRLAFLGDSFTLGLGVRDEDTLPANVERELQHYYGNIEVLNFGVSGSSTSKEIELLEDYVLQFKPDIVVVVLFLNDAHGGRTIDFLSRPWRLAPIRKYSYFVNASLGSVEKIILSKRLIRKYNASFLDTSSGYQEIKSALGKGESLSSKHQLYFIVALYPVLFQLDESYPFKLIHQKIENFCKAEDILFVDLFNAFFGKLDKEMWVHSTDQHPNEVAHRFAAREFVDYIRKKRVIDKILAEEKRAKDSL